MMPFLGDRRSPVRRFGLPLLTGGLLAILVLFVVARVGDRGAGTPAERDGQASAVVTVYSSPTCGCCHEYEKYLEENGFEVESIMTDDLTEIKDELNIPEEMRSCHTAKVGEYFVEGHVPVEAIRKLLEEQPPIGGIALPGMPPGSPGMGGAKEEPFTIYAIVDGEAEEFVTL
jgi:hypothetical protein